MSRADALHRVAGLESRVTLLNSTARVTTEEDFLFVVTMSSTVPLLLIADNLLVLVTIDFFRKIYNLKNKILKKGMIEL